MAAAATATVGVDEPAATAPNPCVGSRPTETTTLFEVVGRDGCVRVYGGGYNDPAVGFDAGDARPDLRWRGPDMRNSLVPEAGARSRRLQTAARVRHQCSGPRWMAVEASTRRPVTSSPEAPGAPDHRRIRRAPHGSRWVVARSAARARLRRRRRRIPRTRSRRRFPPRLSARDPVSQTRGRWGRMRHVPQRGHVRTLYLRARGRDHSVLSTDRMLPAGSLNQAISGPLARTSPRRPGPCPRSARR